MGILLVPGVVQDAEAMTEAECLSISGVSTSEQPWTAVTCQTDGFDVTVYPGQRLMVKDPNGSGTNSMPWDNVMGYGTTLSTGTFQYTDNGGDVNGVVRIVDTPNIGISFQNVVVSFSGSQMTVSGDIVNNNSFSVKDVYVMWSTDAGSVWQRYGYNAQAYEGTISAGGTLAFSETVCCGNGSTATPYVVQAFRDDGTPLIDVNVYPEVASGSPSGTVTASSLSIGQGGTKNGGDCSKVGTWVETTLGPEGGTCTLTADIQITGDGVEYAW